jgi:cellulase/cellobiase CelA1
VQWLFGGSGSGPSNAADLNTRIDASRIDRRIHNDNMTGALPNAPLSGHWFPVQFQQLLQNAFPPL